MGVITSTSKVVGRTDSGKGEAVNSTHSSAVLFSRPRHFNYTISSVRTFELQTSEMVVGMQ